MQKREVIKEMLSELRELDPAILPPVFQVILSEEDEEAQVDAWLRLESVIASVKRSKKTPAAVREIISQKRREKKAIQKRKEARQKLTKGELSTALIEFLRSPSMSPRRSAILRRKEHLVQVAPKVPTAYIVAKSRDDATVIDVEPTPHQVEDTRKQGVSHRQYIVLDTTRVRFPDYYVVVPAWFWRHTTAMVGKSAINLVFAGVTKREHERFKAEVTDTDLDAISLNMYKIDEAHILSAEEAALLLAQKTTLSLDSIKEHIKKLNKKSALKQVKHWLRNTGSKYEPEYVVFRLVLDTENIHKDPETKLVLEEFVPPCLLQGNFYGVGSLIEQVITRLDIWKRLRLRMAVKMDIQIGKMKDMFADKPRIPAISLSVDKPKKELAPSELLHSIGADGMVLLYDIISGRASREEAEDLLVQILFSVLGEEPTEKMKMRFQTTFADTYMVVSYSPKSGRLSYRVVQNGEKVAQSYFVV